MVCCLLFLKPSFVTCTLSFSVQRQALSLTSSKVVLIVLTKCFSTTCSIVMVRAVRSKSFSCLLKIFITLMLIFTVFLTIVLKSSKRHCIASCSRSIKKLNHISVTGNLISNCLFFFCFFHKNFN